MKRHLLALPLLAALALPAAAQRQIRVGQTLQGELTPSSPVLGDGSHYELFRLRLEAGERVLVTLRSEDFDAYLAVGIIDGDDCEQCETDDDGAGGTDARIVYRAAESGVYTLRANTLSEGEVGRYSLSVQPAVSVGSEDDKGLRGTIEAGRTVSGELDDGDPRAGDGSHFETWTFRANATGIVRIVMRSEDFDAYLSVGEGLGEEWEEIDSDDDGAGGTDALLEVEVERGRSYTLRANSLFEGETGRYTLQVLD